MKRLGITILAMVGSAYLTGRWFPTSAHVAFNAGTLGFTWVLLVAMAVGVLTWRSTK